MVQTLERRSVNEAVGGFEREQGFVGPANVIQSYLLSAKIIA